MTPYDRAKIMRKAADLIRERAEKIATVMTMEQGKVFAEARMETMTHGGYFRLVRRGRPPRLWPHHSRPREEHAPAW